MYYRYRKNEYSIRDSRIKKKSNKKVSITAEEIAKDDIKLSEDISKIEN